MIPNGENCKARFKGRQWHYLTVKNYQHFEEK